MAHIDYDHLWKQVLAQYSSLGGDLHGPSHWRRVERNARILASQTGADEEVVRLFALFHDARRENDGYDPGHGERGAELALELHGTHFTLTDAQFELLRFACTFHTEVKYHADVTIGACWDADRLDLGRVSIKPDPRFLNTAAARKIAGQGDVERQLQKLEFKL